MWHYDNKNQSILDKIFRKQIPADDLLMDYFFRTAKLKKNLPNFKRSYIGIVNKKTAKDLINKKDKAGNSIVSIVFEEKMLGYLERGYG